MQHLVAVTQFVEARYGPAVRVLQYRLEFFRTVTLGRLSL